jgi:hypothetical protein
VSFGVGIVLFVLVREHCAEAMWIGSQYERMKFAEMKSEHVPVFEIYGRTIIELETRVVEDYFPVTHAVLCDREYERLKKRTRQCNLPICNRRAASASPLSTTFSWLSSVESTTIHHHPHRLQSTSPSFSFSSGSRGGVTVESDPVSSRKLQTGTTLSEEGCASDTRLGFTSELVGLEVEEEAGNGTLNEKVEVDGGWSFVVGEVSDSTTVDFDMSIMCV